MIGMNSRPEGSLPLAAALLNLTFAELPIPAMRSSFIKITEDARNRPDQWQEAHKHPSNLMRPVEPLTPPHRIGSKSGRYCPQSREHNQLRFHHHVGSLLISTQYCAISASSLPSIWHRPTSFAPRFLHQPVHPTLLRGDHLPRYTANTSRRFTPKR